MGKFAEKLKKTVNEFQADETAVVELLQNFYTFEFRTGNDLVACSKLDSLKGSVQPMVNNLKVSRFLTQLESIGPTCVAAYSSAYLANAPCAKQVQDIMHGVISLLGASVSNFDFLTLQCIQICQKHKLAIENVGEEDLNESWKNMNSVTDIINRCLARIKVMQTDVNGIEQAVTEGAREVLQDKSMSENERKEAVARMAEQEKEREKQKAVQEKLVQNRDKCERAAREIMSKIDSDKVTQASGWESFWSAGRTRRREIEQHGKRFEGYMQQIDKQRDQEAQYAREHLQALNKEMEAVKQLAMVTIAKDDLTLTIKFLNICHGQVMKVNAAVVELKRFFESLKIRFDARQECNAEIVQDLGNLKDAEKQERKEAAICRRIRGSAIESVALGVACHQSQIGISDFSEKTTNLLKVYPTTEKELKIYIDRLKNDLLTGLEKQKADALKDVE